MRLCDRVLVVDQGRVIAELAGDQLTEEAVIHHTLASAPPPNQPATPTRSPR